MRRNWKMILGMVIVLSAAAFACGALAAERAAKEARFIEALVSENSSESSSENSSNKEAWGLAIIPLSGESALFLSTHKTLAFKRFFREKSVEAVVAGQELSIAASAPVGVFSRSMTCLAARLFSAHVAVRK